MRPVWPRITPEKSMAPLHHFFLLLHSHYLPLPSLSPGCAHRSCPMPHARRRCPRPHLATASRQRHRGLHPSAGFMHSALSSRSSLRLLSSPFIPRLSFSSPYPFSSFLLSPFYSSPSFASLPLAPSPRKICLPSLYFILIITVYFPFFHLLCLSSSARSSPFRPRRIIHQFPLTWLPPPPPASILHDRSTRSLSPLSLPPHPPRPSRY